MEHRKLLRPRSMEDMIAWPREDQLMGRLMKMMVGMKMRRPVCGKTAMMRKHVLYVVILLSVVITGCGSQTATPTDVINAWATAATAGDWSRARELMAVGERIFVTWRERQVTINPDVNA